MQFDDYLRTAAVGARAYDSVAQLWQAYIAEHGGPPVMPRRFTTRRPYVCGDTLYKNFVNVRMQRGDPGSAAEERRALKDRWRLLTTQEREEYNPAFRDWAASRLRQGQPVEHAAWRRARRDWASGAPDLSREAKRDAKRRRMEPPGDGMSSRHDFLVGAAELVSHLVRLSGAGRFSLQNEVWNDARSPDARPESPRNGGDFFEQQVAAHDALDPRVRGALLRCYYRVSTE